MTSAEGLPTPEPSSADGSMAPDISSRNAAPTDRPDRAGDSDHHRVDSQQALTAEQIATLVLLASAVVAAIFQRIDEDADCDRKRREHNHGRVLRRRELARARAANKRVRALRLAEERAAINREKRRVAFEKRLARIRDDHAALDRALVTPPRRRRSR